MNRKYKEIGGRYQFCDRCNNPMLEVFKISTQISSWNKDGIEVCEFCFDRIMKFIKEDK